jgi:hypothetical protein
LNHCFTSRRCLPFCDCFFFSLFGKQTADLGTEKRLGTEEGEAFCGRELAK